MHFNTIPVFRSMDLRRFRLLQILRAVFAAILISFIGRTTDLGTASFWLALATAYGMFGAGKTLQKGKSFPRTLIAHACTLAVFAAALWLFENSSANLSEPDYRDFLGYRYVSHAKLILLAYYTGYWSAWIFWCSSWALTGELLFLCVGFVWILSGHRNYHLDAPKNLSSIAWEIGESLQHEVPALNKYFTLGPQHLLIALAAIFAVGVGWYLLLASTRPLFRGKVSRKAVGPAQRILLFATPSILLILLAGYGVYVNNRYSQNMSRATEGVGQEKREGKSPLGFHSAIGKTKQPAALVRLEGDYQKNPWAPMMYFREGALSEFSGKELVIAEQKFDNDIPRVSPGQPWVAPHPPKLDDTKRTEVVQSIFLLTKHDSPFALDEPYSLRLLKNPDPERFQTAYQAASLAPVINIEQLVGEDVGDPSWDKQTWDHYLRAPGSLTSETIPDDFQPQNSPVLLDSKGEDERYRAVVKQIVPPDRTPVERAAIISQYLSENSIYTRSPGHQVAENGDPVAPYLFSQDKRGYCVHFSHAGVYLMRLAGIPARIGTGYLTDTRYAKDGHILLHLGDRHAWPEIYVRGLGWVVMDVTPSKAENEPELIPDEKLLEELMSKLDPAEELTTPPPVDQEDEKPAESIIDQVASSRAGMWVLLATALLFTLRKFWVRAAYRIFPQGPRKARLAYVACVSLLADLGISRNLGETRREYNSRLATSGVNLSQITEMNELLTYRDSLNVPRTEEVLSAVQDFDASFDRSRSIWRRVLAFFSPLTLFRFGSW